MLSISVFILKARKPLECFREGKRTGSGGEGENCSISISGKVSQRSIIKYLVFKNGAGSGLRSAIHVYAVARKII